MRRLCGLLLAVGCGWLSADAQSVRPAAADTFDVIRAVGHRDSAAVRDARQEQLWFVIEGADSAYEQTLAATIPHARFAKLPSGVFPRCNESARGNAPVGLLVRITVTFAAADSATLAHSMRCLSSDGMRHGSTFTHTLSRRGARWIVVSSRAVVS